MCPTRGRLIVTTPSCQDRSRLPAVRRWSVLVVTAVLVTAAGAAVTVPLLLASDEGRPLTASPQAPTGPDWPETATPAAPPGASPATPGPFLTPKPVTIKT